MARIIGQGKQPLYKQESYGGGNGLVDHRGELVFFQKWHSTLLADFALSSTAASKISSHVTWMIAGKGLKSGKLSWSFRLHPLIITIIWGPSSMIFRFLTMAPHQPCLIVSRQPI
ncbi:hypothetical protein OIU84_026507 [Salix udensis]|uniref:Uncharacterized protein n=1 Tax=Salix udensis TaxID=889485 RepID=A0AAD6KP01_9ROSI|nr:hypothetical protein OIU84_026507 [Salix udensis]